MDQHHSDSPWFDKIHSFIVIHVTLLHDMFMNALLHHQLLKLKTTLRAIASHEFRRRTYDPCSQSV